MHYQPLFGTPTLPTIRMLVCPPSNGPTHTVRIQSPRRIRWRSHCLSDNGRKPVEELLSLSRGNTGCNGMSNGCGSSISVFAEE
mmetsp:Transcript_619/g.1125  ORF Transcript_619/g.1125 Transcript_619/m.1125 type:complete len:84 (+) Transcript_619:1399-1650(+)